MWPNQTQNQQISNTMILSFWVYLQLTLKKKTLFLHRYQGVIVRVGRYPNISRKEYASPHLGPSKYKKHPRLVINEHPQKGPISLFQGQEWYTFNKSHRWPLWPSRVVLDGEGQEKIHHACSFFALPRCWPLHNLVNSHPVGIQLVVKATLALFCACIVYSLPPPPPPLVI
jgi:hypothetical protein